MATTQLTAWKPRPYRSTPKRIASYQRLPRMESHFKEALDRLANAFPLASAEVMFLHRWRMDYQRDEDGRLV